MYFRLGLRPTSIVATRMLIYDYPQPSDSIFASSMTTFNHTIRYVIDGHVIKQEDGAQTPCG
jgi:hypothetical protein